jgi:hypothetical protein
MQAMQHNAFMAWLFFIHAATAVFHTLRGKRWGFAVDNPV